MKSKLLYIAYYWEDEFSPLGIQSKRYVEGLCKFYNITVVYRTKEPTRSNVLISESNIKLLPFYTKDYSIWDRRIKKYLIALNDFFSIDDYIWSRKVQRVINFNEYRYLIIASNPFTIQTIGIANNKYIKYIPHLYDPLVDNTFAHLSRFGNFLRKKYEKKIITRANLIFVSNELHKSVLIKRYQLLNDSRIYIVPFCTDLKILDVKKVSQTYKQPLILIHTGNIYGDRKLDLLINTLIYLKDRDADIANRIQLHFYGNISYEEKVRVLNNELNDIVHFFPFIHQINLYRKIASVDGLLLINPGIEIDVFYPSKLCEYLTFEKIIVSISTPVSASNSDILESGNLLFYNDQIKNFADALMNLLNDKNYYANEIRSNFWVKFTPENTATLISNHLEKLK